MVLGPTEFNTESVEDVKDQKFDTAPKASFNSETALDALETVDLTTLHMEEAGMEVDPAEINVMLGSMEDNVNNGMDIKELYQSEYDTERQKSIAENQTIVINKIQNGEDPTGVIQTVEGIKAFSSQVDGEAGWDTMLHDTYAGKDSNTIREELKKFNNDIEAWQGNAYHEFEASVDIPIQSTELGSRAAKSILLTYDVLSGTIFRKAINDFATETVKAYKDFVATPLLKVALGDKLSEKDIEKAAAKGVKVDYKLGMAEPLTEVGRFSADVVRILAPMAGLAKGIQSAGILAKAGKLKDVGTYALAGLVTDLTQFDPYEKNLSNLAKENYGFNVWLTDALASDINDSAVQNRLKNAAEGIVVGTAIDSLIAFIRVSKNAKILRREISRVVTATKLKKVFGDAKTFALYRADVDTLASLFKTLEFQDEKSFKSLVGILEGADDSLADKLRIAYQKSQDTTTEIAKPVYESVESSAARMGTITKLTGDEGGLGQLHKGMSILLSPEPSKVKEVVEKAFQVGDAGKLAALTPSPEEFKALDPASPFEIEMSNGAKVAESGLADDYFHGVITSRQQTVADIIQTHVYKSEIDYGPIANSNWERELSWKNAWGGNALVSAPVNYLGKEGGQDLVISATNQWMRSNSLKNAFINAEKAIYKGLGRKQKQILNHLIVAADDIETPFRTVSGGILSEDGRHFLPATPDVVDSFFAMRRLDDRAYELANTTAKNDAVRKGYKVFKGDHLVKEEAPEIGKMYTDSAGRELEFTVELKERGAKLYSFYNEEDVIPVILKADELPLHVKEIPDNFPVIGKKQNHMPRTYKDDFYIIELSKDGGKRTTYTAPTASRAANLTKKLAKESPDKQFLFVRNGGDVNIGKSTAFAKILRNAKETEVEAIRNSMVAAGVPKEKVDAFIAANHKKSFIKNRHHKARGEILQADQPRTVKDPITGEKQVVTTAELEYSKDAFSKYYAGMSEFIELGELKSIAQDKYLKTFGEVLTDPKDWTSLPDFRKYGSRAMQAALYQGQLKSISRVPSIVETWLKAAKDERVFKLANGTKTQQVLANIRDALPTLYGTARFAKGTAAVTYLYAGSLAQLGMQMSQMISVIGVNTGRFLKNPLRSSSIITKANANFINVIAPSAIRELPFNKAGKTLKDELLKSGFVADIDFDPLRTIVDEIDDVRQLTGGMRSMVKGAVELSGKPFKLGEFTQRTYAWINEREFLIDEIKRGANTQFTMKDIFTDAFRSEVNKRAMVLAHNMSRMNQPLMAKGLASIPFQMKQVFVHQASLLLNRQGTLNKAEVAGLWLAYLGILGPTNAVPMIETIFTGAENLASNLDPSAIGFLTEYAPEKTGEIAEEMLQDVGYYSFIDSTIDELGKMNTPEAITSFVEGRLDWNKDDFRNFIEGGALSVAVKGKYNFSARIGMAGMFSEYLKPQPVHELLGGAAYSVAKKYVTGTSGEIKDFWRIVRNEHMNYQDKAAALAQATPYNLAEVFPAVRTYLEASPREGGELRRISGEIITEDPSLADQLAIIFGGQAGDIAREQKSFYTNLRAKKVYKEWMISKAERIVANTTNKPELYDSYMEEALTEIQRLNNPMLISNFMNLVLNMKMNSDRTTAQKNLFRTIDNMIVESGWDNTFKSFAGE